MTAVPLSYMVRATEQAAANTITQWWTRDILRSTENYQIGRGLWLKGNQVFGPLVAAEAGLTVKFTFNGFDPNLSAWTYGDPKIIDDTIEPVPGATYLFDNRSHDEPLEVDLQASVTYGQSRSTQTSHEIDVDLKIGSKTTGTIGGDAEGAKLETEVSAELGIGSKDETAKATAEDTARTTTQDVKTDVSPYGATLGIVSSPTITQLRPFAINGIVAAGLSLRYSAAAHGWAKPLIDSPATTLAKGFYTTTFDAWADFTDMLAGVNTDFPLINGPFGWAGRIRRLSDPNLRRLVWSGIEHRKYQKASDYAFTDVKANEDVDALLTKYGIEADHHVRPKVSGA